MDIATHLPEKLGAKMLGTLLAAIDHDQASAAYSFNASIYRETDNHNSLVLAGEESDRLADKARETARSLFMQAFPGVAPELFAKVISA